MGDGFRFPSLEREVRHGLLLAADFLEQVTENTPASHLCLTYLLISLRFSHDRDWDCLVCSWLQGIQNVTFVFLTVYFYSLPPLSSPTPSYCNVVILTAFPLLWENLLSPIQELKTQKLSSSKSCLRLNGRRWIPFSSAKIFQCSVSAPYHCHISCHHQLVRKAWLLTILARFRYQAPEMKQRSLQSVTSKSGWILL